MEKPLLVVPIMWKEPLPMPARCIGDHMRFFLPHYLFCIALGWTVNAKCDRAAPDIAGRWAVRTVASQVIDVPMIGDVVSESHALVLLRVRQRGKALSIKQKLCSLRVDMSSQSIRMAVPRKFTRAVRWDSYSAEIVWEDSRWMFKRAPIVRIYGAALAQPKTEPLPVRTDDPRVRDLDKDGKPGVTFSVSGLVTGRIYAVTRDISALSGTIATDGKSIRGLIDLRRERKVLSASTPLLGASPLSRPHPDAERSTFMMVKVSKAVGCKQVRATAEHLFKMN